MSALSVKKWLCVMLCVCLLFSLATPFALSEELPAVSVTPESAAEPVSSATVEATPVVTVEPTPALAEEVTPVAEAAEMPTATAEPAPTVTA